MWNHSKLSKLNIVFTVLQLVHESVIKMFMLRILAQTYESDFVKTGIQSLASYCGIYCKKFVIPTAMVEYS